MSIWRSLFERFFGTKFRQNVLVLTSGNLIVQAIALLSYPILTRLYPDEVFGQYALFNGVVLLLTFAITLRYEVAIPLPKLDEHAEILKKSTLFIAIAFSVLLLIAALIWQQFNLYPPLNDVILLIPIVALVSSFLQIYRFWYLRVDNLVRYFKILIGYRSLYTITAIIIPLMAIGFSNGLITAITFSSTIILLVAVVIHRTDLKLNLNLTRARSILNEHYRFPRYSLPSFVIRHVTNQIPIFLIAYYFDEGTTGQYSVAYALLFLPQTMLMGRISEAMYQNFSLKKKHELRAIVFKIWKWVFFIMLIPCFILFFFGSQVFQLILGKDWALAGIISEYFAILILIGSLISSTAGTLNLLNLQKIGFFMSIFKFFYITSAFIISGLMNDLMIAIKITVIMTSLSDLGLTLFLFKRLS